MAIIYQFPPESCPNPGSILVRISVRVRSEFGYARIRENGLGPYLSPTGMVLAASITPIDGIVSWPEPHGIRHSHLSTASLT